MSSALESAWVTYYFLTRLKVEVGIHVEMRCLLMDRILDLEFGYNYSLQRHDLRKKERADTRTYAKTMLIQSSVSLESATTPC